MLTEKDVELMLKKNPALKVNFPKVAKTKSNKYKNQKVYIYSNGFVSAEKNQTANGNIIATFDSKKEYSRWKDLLLLEKAKKIKNLSRQTTLVIQEPFSYGTEKIRAITYKADFSYETLNGDEVVEDVKTFDEATNQYKVTKDFAIKWKLLKYRFPKKKFLLY